MTFKGSASLTQTGVNDVYNGSADSLITEKSDIGKVLETIKKVSRKKLYTSFEAESIELTGYAVISGILKRYERILKLTYDDFEKIVFSQNVKGKGSLSHGGGDSIYGGYRLR